MKGACILYVVLSVGLGSLLTLLSCFYAYEPRPDFLDQVPNAYKSVSIGYPFPVFLSYAESWSNGQLSSGAVFGWAGALLDVIFYALIVFGVISIVPAVATTIKAHKTKVAE